MRICVIGGGGREHALCWKFAQEGHEVFCAPGNPGIGEVAETVPHEANNRKAVLDWVTGVAPDLVVVGPEDPLIAGMADMFREHGIAVFGPGQDAARLEGSKAFSKDLMKRAGIPTARHQTFSDASAAKQYAEDEFNQGRAVVVKASGAALGKGVVVCDSVEEAHAAIESMLVDLSHGEAGRTVVVEERLSGREFSLMTLVSGQSIHSLPVAQDYKRILDGDDGPNTGGMGSYSPVDWVGSDIVAQVERDIVRPILNSLSDLDIDFRGVLFSGILVQDGMPFCLEYNVRFGDPEIQSIVRRLGDGFAEALLACANGEPIPPVPVLDVAACSVVVASEGYPGPYEKGCPLEIGEVLDGVEIFHAGTKVVNDGLVTNGGRVAAVSATGSTAEEARAKAYAGVGAVRFAGMHYRRDIGL
ncbi:MAG: phosphoribosylamine--glycine ligase [Armatimonadetes bacterium]|nr:phosphoribosylamine--glycine ligase [Armatimonadota bacterium]MBS1712539.1 phosphoribosylamine--glycine ligase [Armatimonadota bacterium]MBX3109152.1 phosphoribosylamine--glycine ligase [Fimbriimonadaceae bacterium]